MKKALITFGSGKYAELLDIATPSYKAFADRHGYDFFIADRVGTSRPAPWYKVRCLIDLLNNGYHMAAFFGCDMVIVDGRDDFDLQNGDFVYWQAMVAHQTGDGHVPNTDMWAVYKPMLPYLEQVWSLDNYINHGWWEQAALMELMGYDPLNKPTRCLYETELYKHTYWLDLGWNMHKWDKRPVERPRIRHATMYPDRAAVMRQWAEEAQKGWMSDVHQPAG